MERYRDAQLLSARLGALLALVVCLLATGEADAKGGVNGFGLGIVLGDPSGLTGKYWTSGDEAVGFHLAFDFDDNNRDSLYLIVDYQFHLDLFSLRSSSVSMPAYVGVGGKLGWYDRDRPNRPDDDDDDRVVLGIRIPLGLSLQLKKAPLEFFGEIAPSLWVVPSTDGHLDAGIGVRYYF